MSKILDYLYLGSYYDSTNSDFLESENIKTIINLAIEKNHVNMYPGIRYYKLGIEDSFDQNILNAIEKCHDLINENKKNGNVLVNCYAGKSRSASCVIAHLIKEYNHSYNDAYLFVKNKRPLIEPNQNFKNQLIKYENEYKKQLQEHENELHKHFANVELNFNNNELNVNNNELNFNNYSDMFNNETIEFDNGEIVKNKNKKFMIFLTILLFIILIIVLYYHKD